MALALALAMALALALALALAMAMAMAMALAMALAMAMAMAMAMALTMLMATTPKIQGCKADSLQQGCTCSLVLNTTPEHHSQPPYHRRGRDGLPKQRIKE